MNTDIKKSFLPLLLVVFVQTSSGQGMQMGEVIIVTTPELKNDKSGEDLRRFMLDNVAPAWNNGNQRVNFHLFQADRGNMKGKYLVVCNVKEVADRKESLPAGSPFKDEVMSSRSSKKPSEILSNPEAFTEYHLLGANKFRSLPDIGILGIHYIKVKKERANDFEKFTIEKMHPAVGTLLPNMHLLT